MNRILRLEDPQYEIYLPLKYNNGEPIEEKKYNQTREDLLFKFGGLTVMPPESPAEGYWRSEGIIYRDEIIIYRILSIEDEDDYFIQLKKTLCNRFKQEEIFITKAPVDQL